MPTSLKEMVTVRTDKGIRVYKKNASPFADVLIALDHAGGFVEDKSGLASRRLKESCQTKKVREMTISGFSGLMNRLEDAGWVNRTLNGKRTYRIGLSATIPSDVLDWLVFEDDETVETKPERHLKFVDTPPTETTTGDAETAGPSGEVSLRVEPTALPSVGDDTDVDIATRSGRFAARLERELPDSIATAVMEAIKADRDYQQAALGYYPTIPPEELERMTNELERHDNTVAQLQTVIEDLSEERTRNLTILDYYMDQEDERLLRTNEGQAAGKGSLTANQVHDSLKGLARVALTAGWTIKRTRGGHLLWRSPEGKAVFSASTPSTMMSAKTMMTRKLRRQGLVIEGRAQESADEDMTGGWSSTSTNERK